MGRTDTTKFIDETMSYFYKYGRTLPWRIAEPGGMLDPYKILVSEMMLQQTQVPRVIPKFESFIKRFPTSKALADSSLNEVLVAWNGLGYNRRAKYLLDASKALVDKPQPWTAEDLQKLKGLGSNTAAAILVYAYDCSLPFIETNVRSVFIHHFFKDEHSVSDKQIELKLTEVLKTVQTKGISPRKFYWALMDRGSLLKKTEQNPSRRSKSHTKQTVFEGSRRQVRGKVLQLLGTRPHSLAELTQPIQDKRLDEVLQALVSEGLIEKKGSNFQLFSG